MTTPHCPLTARLWRESAALNSWVCKSQRTSPGPPTLHHSQRRRNSAYTFSAGWKEQVSLHPSSALSKGEPLRVCWQAVSLPGMGTVVQQTSRPSSVQWTQLQRSSVPLPSILDIFLAWCSSKATSIVKEPTHPSHSLFQLQLSGRRYQSIRARNARLLNSFFPRLWLKKSPCPSLKPQQTPTSWNMDHHPPQTPPNLPHHRKKLKLFLCNSKCATHRWVGLYKPPVVTHSPLFAIYTFHTLLCDNPTKTQ